MMVTSSYYIKYLLESNSFTSISVLSWTTMTLMMLQVASLNFVLIKLIGCCIRRMDCKFNKLQEDC